MKMLLLLRHGKSPRKGANDWERPLSKRARKQDVPLVAQFVLAKGLAPGQIISSDARRAKETAQIFGQQFAASPELSFTRELYLASANEIAGTVQVLPHSACTVVLVGHNPGLEMLAEMLTGAELPAALKPGGLCIFRLAIDSWLDLHPSTATLSAFVNPAELRS